MDKWICNKCGFVTFEKPVKRVETCAKCHSGRYRLIKTCVCGKEFHPDKSTALFCSLTCARRFGKTGGRKGKHYPREQRAKIKICPVCGIEFRAVNDCKSHQQVYCSKKCWEVRAHEIRICPTCGKEFHTHRARNKIYCSQECRDKDYRERLVGENSHLWKGGKTTEEKIARSKAAYRDWRKQVFERDGYTCQICGTSDEPIEAHHLKPVKDYPDLIYDVDNGLTLCYKCHKAEHKAMRKLIK